MSPHLGGHGTDGADAGLDPLARLTGHCSLRKGGVVTKNGSPLSDQSVLVTGGTGFTGSHLIRQLTALGAHVRAIARPTSDRTSLEDCPVEWLLGDVFDPKCIETAMQDVSYVFHLATLYRSGAATEEEHRQVHLESTQLIATAARQQSTFRRLVHVSTVGVHGHIEDPPADETAPIRPGDEYQRTKAAAEQWLTAFASEHDLPYAIIRPAAIYGPGDRRLLKLFRMARRPIAPILGKRPCLYHLIHVEDLVNIMIQAANHPNALGEAFIAGNPTPIALDEMLRVIGAAWQQQPRIWRLPIAPFWAAAVCCEAICPRLGFRPPLYRRRIKFFLNDRAFDTRKLQTKLNYSYRYSNETGLQETARWYRAQGWA